MVLMFLGLLYIQQHESLIVPIVEYRSAVRGMCCCFTGHGLFNTSCYFYFIDPWFKEETFLFYKEKSEWEKYCKKKKKKKYMKNILLKEWVKVKFLLFGGLKKISFVCDLLIAPPMYSFSSMLFWALYQGLSEYVTVCRLSSSHHIIKVQNVFHVGKRRYSVDLKFFPGKRNGDLLSHNKLNSRFLQRS